MDVHVRAEAAKRISKPRVAMMLASMGAAPAADILHYIAPKIAAGILAEMDEVHAAEIIRVSDNEKGAKILASMKPALAADVIYFHMTSFESSNVAEHLSPDERRRIISAGGDARKKACLKAQLSLTGATKKKKVKKRAKKKAKRKKHIKKNKRK